VGELRAGIDELVADGLMAADLAPELLALLGRAR
jgi:hypothetical protein